MKKISVLIPCYNEEENVVPISEAVIGIITKELPQYDYELVFIDNDSTDKTRELLRMLCAKNPKIKAIFNARNFGQFNSPYYGILQVTGDCVISMVADFQDPVELIPKYVHEWENGYKIVIGIKTSSKENPLMYWLRSCYYKLIRKLSDVEQIEHFTGSGLYDGQFIEVLRNLVYLIMKLLYWDRFAAGMAPLLIGMCFLGSVQIFFIGLLGEYIMSINTRVMHRPLVVEEERINFDTPAAQEEV